MKRRLLLPLATIAAVILGTTGAWAQQLDSVAPTHVNESPTTIQFEGSGATLAVPDPPAAPAPPPTVTITTSLVKHFVEIMLEEGTKIGEAPVTGGGEWSCNAQVTFSGPKDQKFKVLEKLTYTIETTTVTNIGTTAETIEVTTEEKTIPDPPPAANTLPVQAPAVVFDNTPAEKNTITSNPNTIKPGEQVTITVSWKQKALDNPMDQNADAKITLTLDDPPREITAGNVSWTDDLTMQADVTIPPDVAAGASVVNAFAYTKCGMRSIDIGGGPIIEAAITEKPTLTRPRDGAALNTTTPTFTWSATTGADHYTLEIGTQDDDAFTPDVHSERATSPHELPDGIVSHGNAYFWRVSAYDAGDNQLTSEAVWGFSIDTNARALQAPVDGYATHNRRPAFSWEAFANPTDANYIAYASWQIQLQISKEPSFNSIDENASSTWMGPSVTTFTARADLDENTTYYWRVVAKDGPDTDTYTNLNNLSAVRLLIIDTEGLQPPELVAPPDGTVTLSPGIEFRWKMVHDAQSYLVEIDPSGHDFTGADLMTAEVTATGESIEIYSTTSLTNNGEYYWRVSSRDGIPPQGNLSYPSESWKVTIDRQEISTDGIELVDPDDADYEKDNTPLYKWSHEYTDIPEEGDRAAAYHIQWSDSRTFSSTNTLTHVYTLASQDNYAFAETEGTAINGAGINQTVTHENYVIAITGADDVQASFSVTDRQGRSIDNVMGVRQNNHADSAAAGIRIYLDDVRWYMTPTNMAEADIRVQTLTGKFDFEWELTEPTYTALTDGDWYWRIKPVDTAGNTGGNTHWTYYNKFTVDTLPPDPPVIDSPQNGTVVTSTTIDVVLSLLGGDAVEVSVYAVSPWAGGNTGTVTVDENSIIGGPVDVPLGAESITVTVDISAIDGMKAITATAKDQAGNVSDGAIPVSFILDRTDPKIANLIIQDYGTGSTTVTDPNWSGKLLVTVEFSEAMDTDTEPIVTVTPDSNSGDALTAIGLSNLGLGGKSWSDTATAWTGLVRIPKGPGYDGMATIAISGQCKDMAGKVLRSKTFPSYFEIDTAPRMIIRVFYNPTDERDVIIGIESSEALRLTPSCRVTVGGETYDIMMNHISQYMYTGVHRLTTNQVGTLKVLSYATDLSGNTAEHEKSFALNQITVAKGGAIASADGRMRITVPAGAVDEDRLVALLPAYEQEFEQAQLKQYGSAGARAVSAIRTASGQGLVMAGPAHDLGPHTVQFTDYYIVSLKVDPDNLSSGVSTDKLGAYVYAGGKWRYMGSAREDGDWIKAPGRSTGIIALMADLKRPDVYRTYPDEDDTPESDRPTIEVWLEESGSGIKPESVSVKLDGRTVEYQFDAVDNLITFKPSKPLSKGEHELSVELSDRAGNVMAKRVVPFQAAGPFGVVTLKNYPNPVDPDANDVKIRYTFNQNTSKVDIDIFDSTGDLVRTIFDADQPVADGPNWTGEELWDGTNDFGDTVANGVYIYRLRATNVNGDSTMERTGKIAVLR